MSTCYPSACESLVHAFMARATTAPAAPALAYRQEGEWVVLSFGEVAKRVAHAAQVLAAHGVRQGDAVAIWAPTRFEWMIAELGVQSCGGAVVGLDPSLASDAARKIMEESAITCVVADAQTLAQHHTTLAALNVKSVEIAALVSGVVEVTDPAPLLSSASLRATRIFTSGTTGAPKAIDYSHAQVLAAIDAIVEAWPELESAQRTIAWLPMSALFQRVLNHVAWKVGACIHFVDDPKDIAQALASVQPDVFAAVPRFYQKVYEALSAQTAGRGLKARLLAWALNVEPRSFVATFARDLVLRPLHKKLGGKNCAFVSGSAALDPHVAAFFARLGRPILEAYGQSENTVPIAMSTPKAWRMGSAGRLLKANQVRIATDGELWMSGPGVCVEQEIATGDLVEIDKDGFVFITGRKNDLIKTSTGRRIAPGAVETVYRQSPLLQDVVVLGDGCPYLVALVTLREGVKGVDAAAVEAQFASLGRSLPSYQRVKRVVVLPRPFSVEQGELTTSLKVRRKHVAALHAEVIRDLYPSGGALRKSAAPAVSSSPASMQG